MGFVDSLKRLFSTSKEKGAEKVADIMEKASGTIPDAKEVRRNVSGKLESVSEVVVEKAHEAVHKAKEFGTDLVEKSEHLIDKLDERATHVVDKLEARIRGEELKSPASSKTESNSTDEEVPGSNTGETEKPPGETKTPATKSQHRRYKH